MNILYGVLTYFVLSLAFTSNGYAVSFLNAQDTLKQSSRVALYVGSFDPMHLGHQTIVNEIISRNLADVVIVIPQNLTLHKPNATAYEIRRKMIETLYKEHPKVIYPDAEIDVFRVKSGAEKMIKHYFSGSLSVTNVILNHLRELNPQADLYNVTGTDIIEKKYMRAINARIFREFKGHIVSVWMDAPESMNVLLPKKLGNVPIVPLQLYGLPRISSSQIKKDLKSGTWPSVLNPELKTHVFRDSLYEYVPNCRLLFL